MWLKDKLSVNFPLDSEGLTRDAKSPMMHYLIIASYKNLSSLLAPGDGFQEGPEKISSRTSTELISPIVQISIPDGYYFPSNSPIKIRFTLSKEYRSFIKRSPKTGQLVTTNFGPKGTYFSCGALANTNDSTITDNGRLRWTMNSCSIEIQSESYLECQCGTLGIFGLLKVSNLEDVSVHNIMNMHETFIFQDECESNLLVLILVVLFT